MQQDPDPKDCNSYDCVDEGGGIIRCYNKDDREHKNPLQTFTVGAVQPASVMGPGADVEASQKEMANVKIEHAILYLNNKPGRENTFGYHVGDGAVTFMSAPLLTVRNQVASQPTGVFTIPSDYLVVDQRANC